MKTIETTLTVTDKGTAVVTKFTDTAKKQFGEVESSVKKTDKAFDGLGKTIAKLTAGYLSLRAAMDFSKMVVQHLDIVDSINKMSERLGISTKLFQEMRYAMSLSGVTLQEFEVGMRRFVTGLYDATKGTGMLVDSMHKYGITAGNTEDVLDQVANLIQRTTNEQERLNIATTFFGDRVGMSFISLMKDGAAGLAKFKKEAAELGLVLSKEDAEGATEAKDALEKMGAVVENIKNKLVVALAPALKDVADKTLEWYKANKQLVDEKVKTFVESLSTIITSLANNIDIVVEAVKVLANLLGAVIIGYVVGLTVKIGLWTAALVYNAVMHIKATAALYQFGLAAANGGRIMGLVTIAARTMWTALGGPVGVAVGVAFLLLQFIGIEKIVNALKTAFDYILTTVKSIGTAISNWFAGGSTLDEQISAAEKRVENERKNLESMKKMGGGKDDLRVAAARLAKEEAILATLKAQKTTTTELGTGASESKYIGVSPTYTDLTTGGTNVMPKEMQAALNDLALMRQKALADTLEKEKAVALAELDKQMNAELVKFEWTEQEKTRIRGEYAQIRAKIEEEWNEKIRIQGAMKLSEIASTQFPEEAYPSEGRYTQIYQLQTNQEKIKATSTAHLNEMRALQIEYYKAAGMDREAALEQEQADYEAALEKYKNNVQALEIVEKTHKKAMEEIEKSHNSLYQGLKKLGDSIQANVTDAIVDAITGAKTLKESFTDLIKSMASDLLRLGMQMLWLNSIKALFGESSGGSFGNILAGLFSSVATAANGAIFPGGFKAFATGGVATKPTLGLVGEGRYNEAIVPLPDGKSIPVTMKGGGNVNTTINVSVNGSSGSKEDNQKMGNQLAEVINYKFKEMLAKEMRVGGMLRRAA